MDNTLLIIKSEVSVLGLDLDTMLQEHIILGYTITSEDNSTILLTLE
jgi:hypothetical protein